MHEFMTIISHCSRFVTVLLKTRTLTKLAIGIIHHLFNANIHMSLNSLGKRATGWYLLTDQILSYVDFAFSANTKANRSEIT